MSFQVVCFCGFPIGQFYPIYQKLYKDRQIKVCEENDIKDDMLNSNLKINVKTEDILDELNIKSMCCRLHIITAQ